jgi:hypothetical protein
MSFTFIASSNKGDDHVLYLTSRNRGTSDLRRRDRNGYALGKEFKVQNPPTRLSTYAQT